MGRCSMIAVDSANNAPYWPECARDPAFLSWLSRILTAAANTRPDTPERDLLRMAGKQGAMPADWGLAVLFLMEHANAKK